jgi:hypothetical protein
MARRKTQWHPLLASAFAGLHPAAWKEVKAMAKSTRGRPKVDLEAVVELVGGLDKMIEQLGEKQLLEQMGSNRIVANLTPAQRREVLRLLSAEATGKGG